MGFATIDRARGRPPTSAGYLPDRGLATALFLALTLEKPLLLEGEAGVGKTEAAKALAAALGARLIRLQCYEGLDIAHAVYEWNYPRQLLHIRAAQEGTVTEDELFGPRVPDPAPAARGDRERGAGRAPDRRDRPRGRRVRGVPARGALGLPDHDPRDRDDARGAAAGRRAHVEPHARAPRRAQAPLPLPLDRAPEPRARDRDRQAARSGRCPSGSRSQAAAFVHGLRGLDLAKPPGVAETIDWAQALAALGRDELDAAVVEETLGSVLKYHEDLELVRDSALARSSSRRARFGPRERRQADRPPGRHLRPLPARGGARGRPGSARRRAHRPRRGRRDAAGRRLLDAPRDARHEGRGDRGVRPRVPAPGSCGRRHAADGRAAVPPPEAGAFLEQHSRADGSSREESRATRARSAGARTRCCARRTSRR